MRSATVFAVCLVLLTMVCSGFAGPLAGALSPRPTADAVIAASTVASDQPAQVLRIPLTFGDLTATEENGYTYLTLGGATGYLKQPDAPMLPVYSEMLHFPVNTRITSVGIEGTVHSETYSALKVMPAPEPILLVAGASVLPPKEGPVYSQSTLFPDNEVDRMVTTGQGDWGGIEAHLFVKVYPIRYNPLTSVLIKLESGDLVIKYIPPPAGQTWRPMDNQPHYDLLVLHPDAYGDALKPYYTHKEQMGWKIKNVSLSEIYSNNIFDVSKGRDNTEKIKIFIKQALENWTMNYVMIVGDANIIPIRHVYDLDGADGSSTPSDLYYADIYKGGTMQFSDWNANNNGLWGESIGSGANANVDKCDLDPDIAVGRIPVGSVMETQNVVNKIISYDENITQPDAYDWFKNATLVGSDSFPASHGDSSGIAEGEYTMNYDTQFLGGFRFSKFYETQHTLVESNVLKSLNRGAGIMAFADHGNVGIVVAGLTYGGVGMQSSDAMAATNGHMLPLDLMDACLTHAIDYEESIGEYLILNPNGGAIGSIGATREGWGYFGADDPLYLSGFMDTHIFQEHQNATIMPPLMVNQAVRDYIKDLGIGDQWDFKSVVEYIYLGDPIVWIGGPGIHVEPANNPLTLAPGETGKFLVGINNTGLVSDDVKINMTGGKFTYGLSTGFIHMSPDRMTYVTVEVTVPSNARVTDKENVTIVVTPKSTTIPISTNLTTIVKAVRDLRFNVPKTDLQVAPGKKVSVGFSLDNHGNVDENATATLTGGDGAFAVSAMKVGIVLPAFNKTTSSLQFDVPDGTHAGIYYLQLTFITASGLTATYIITLHVTAVDGLRTFIIHSSQTFGPDNKARYQVFMANTGNHRESFDLSLALGDQKTWGNNVVWDLPGTVVLDAGDNVTENFMVTALSHTLAGNIGLNLTVASTAQGGPKSTMPLTAIVPRTSGISMTTDETRVLVSQGQTAKFMLTVMSGSNFQEDVGLSVTGIPKDWTMVKGDDPVLPAFSSGVVNLSLIVPAKYLAGDYPLTVTATGNASKAVVGIVVEVKKAAAVSLSLDKTEISGYPGDRQDILVTVTDLGNFNAGLILGIDSVTSPFEGTLSARTIDVAAWSKGQAVLTVMIPDDSPVKDGTLTVRVQSVSNAGATATAQVTLHSLFKARPDMSVRSQEGSSGFVGQTSSFTVFLVNHGNIDENVTFKNNGTYGWDLQFPANVTLGPGEAREVTVTYTIPNGTSPGQYPIDLALSSADGNWDVKDTATAQKAPVTVSKGAGGSNMPYLLAILVLIVLVCLLAVLLIIMGRAKKR